VNQAVIVSAARTPVGRFLGGLGSIPAPKLGAVAVSAAIERAGISVDDVDEVLMGNVLSAGLGQNVARQAAVGAGVPTSVPATTVNKLCGSGLKTVALAAQAIRAGDAEVIVAGGTENMSAAPYLLDQAREGYRLGYGTLIDSMQRDGLECAICNLSMGETAENIVDEYEIGREDQDAFAVESQARAAVAIEQGAFDDEVVAVEVPQRRSSPVVIARDEHPRVADYEQLAKLRPAFRPNGTVTAGNSSGINDGAAATVVMEASRAERLGIAPLAVIRSYATSGVDPRIMGMGPVGAVRGALEKAGISVGDLELIELNEAFAAQSLAVCRELGLPSEITNVHGGAIALGHPIGASGARVLTTLLYGMAQRDVHLALAALCIGGGQGIAMVVERPAP